MRKTKRFVSLVMALAIVSGIGLTGCKKDNGATTSTTGSLKAATLNYWIIGPGKQKDSDKVWAEFNKEIQKNLPNTTVNFTVVTGDTYKEKWSKSMAAQEQIDIAWTGWMLTIQDEVNKGSIMALDTLLDRYGKDLKESLGTKVIDIHRSSDGKIYQIPAWQGMVGNRSSLRFPKEIADTVGSTFAADTQKLLYDNYKTPTAAAKTKVYEQMEKYLSTAKTNGKLAKGYATGNLSGWYLMKGTNEIASYGIIDVGDNTFKVKSKYESELQQLNFKYMADWFKKGYIRSDIASLEKVGITWDTDKTWKNSYITDAHNGFTDDIAKTESVRNGFDIVAAYSQPDCEYTLGTATGTSIPKTSKNPERAMMLMNLLVTDKGKDAYQTFTYGIKGTHWTDNGDGTIKTLGGSGQGTADWAYGMWKWTLGTCMNSLVTQADTKGYYDALKAKEKTAYVSPLLSFKFDNTKVQTQQAQLDAVFKEYGEMLGRGYLGDGWKAKYDQFIAKLKTAGLDAYLAEEQSQVTAFVTKNKSKW